MTIWAAVLTATVGYLVGSLSFARIVMRFRAPEREYRKIHRDIPGSDTDFEGRSVSANSVREQLGSRAGCLTALLDASKAAIVTLVFLAWQPNEPYYLIAAAAAIAGHIYPIYHRFEGGMGLSTVYGAFFVVDWLGVVVTTLASTIFGILVGRVLVVRWSGVVLMIPWLWWTTGDPWQVGFAVVANALYWVAMIPELRQYFYFKAEGTLPGEQDIAELLGMGSFWKKVSRYSLRRSAGATKG
jgi:glycerol-3-phosphate acyltransferase PlsY